MRFPSAERLFLGATGFLRGLVQLVFVLGVMGAIFVGGALALAIAHFSRDLPDHQQLLSYQPATGSKIYAGDGSLMAEFATERRIITPFKDIPPLVVKAFLSAEDRDFYSHNGVNPASVLRAALADIVRYGRGQRPLGASTITQQLVRHFLLTNEVSISRKIKEALLAYRIENQLSKDRILEIYLNEIYLGAGSYGVAAAAETYFGKPLGQLTLAEVAYLAALPKAPNNYNPQHHPQAAKARRDWVLDGMAEQGWVTAADAEAAKAQPLGATVRPQAEPPGNGYFLEEVRRELIERYGEKTVYEGGLTVRTSYVPVYQAMAEKAFRNGLVEYDRRHGWRGPVAHLGNVTAAQAVLYSTPEQTAMPGWRLAAVTGVDTTGATILLKSGATGRIPLDEMRWARRTLPDQRLGAGVYRAHDVVGPGDIVLVEPLGAAGAAAPQPAGRRGPAPLLYGLRQVPDVSGGFVAMDPKTGRVFAIVGGWDYHESQFDRAVQAKRQPGSSIKPFVYVTALQSDYTPSSVIEDTPISLPQGPGMPMWTPANYEGNYVGATTLRQALIHSRNLATARLASQIGMPSIAKTVEQFHIMDKMPLYYSMALGAGDTTLYRLTGAYAMLDNGGHWLNTSLIDMVQDVHGRILYQKGTADCAACFIAAGQQLAPDKDPAYTIAGRAKPSLIWLKGAAYADHPLLYKPTKPDPLVDPIADAEIISMMEGVVQEGTGIKVAAVGKPLAGKTGTTSDWFDAWFVGFSPDLAAGAFVGFDTPRTLGDGETGGNVAAPIFRDFMADALKDQPALPFPQNPGAEMVLINSISGQPTVAGDKDAVLAPFRPGTGPASHPSYGGQQVAAAPSGYPTAQEAADAIDGGAPIDPAAGAPPPAGRAALAGSSMMPVNARIPGGVPGGGAAPPARLMPGTGGLY
ncbi:MAG TPA: PBP1A family penicillin-binding protein [Stellaceae bacterium]|nr:PBP1A family penicillin-binding protein [Stellaceae bacterium]